MKYLNKGFRLINLFLTVVCQLLFYFFCNCTPQIQLADEHWLQRSVYTEMSRIQTNTFPHFPENILPMHIYTFIFPQIRHTYTYIFPCNNTLPDIRHQKEGQCKGPNVIDRKKISKLCVHKPLFWKTTSKRHLLFKFVIRSD